MNSLPPTVVDLILKKVDRWDFKACRTVCKSWKRLIDLNITGLTSWGRSVDECISVLLQLHRWPNLTQIALSFSSGYRSTDICREADLIIIALIRAEKPALKRLKISNMEFPARSAFWQRFAQHLGSQLEILEFERCSFDNGALKSMGSNEWDSILELHFKACKFGEVRRSSDKNDEDDENDDDGPTDFGIHMAALFSNCHFLKKFELDCQHIQRIEADVYIRPSDLEAIMSVKHTALEEFHFTICQLGNKLGEIFSKNAANWPALRILNVQGALLRDGGLTELSKAEMPKLEELNINWESSQYSPRLPNYRHTTESLLALRSALETKWTCLKKLSMVPNCEEEDGKMAQILLGGNVPFRHLQEIVTRRDDKLRLPQAISAFAKAAKLGLLPSYQHLRLELAEDNIEQIAELLSADWPSLKTISLAINWESEDFVLSTFHETILVAGMLKGSFPSLTELFLPNQFSFFSAFKILNSRPWIKLQWLNIHSFMTDEDVDAFIKARLVHFPNVRVIGIWEGPGGDWLDKSILKVGSAYWPKLHHIRFSHADRVEEPSMSDNTFMYDRAAKLIRLMDDPDFDNTDFD